MALSQQSALELVDQIERLIDDSTPAHRAAATEIQQLAHRLHGAPGDPAYIGEKLGALRAWASIYFSSRKHMKYGGPDKVRYLVRMECSKLRMMIGRSAHSDLNQPS